MLFLIEKNNIFVSIEMSTPCNSTFFQRLLHRLLVHSCHLEERIWYLNVNKTRASIELYSTNISWQRSWYRQMPLLTLTFHKRKYRTFDENNHLCQDSCTISGTFLSKIYNWYSDLLFHREFLWSLDWFVKMEELCLGKASNSFVQRQLKHQAIYLMDLHQAREELMIEIAHYLIF